MKNCKTCEFNNRRQCDKDFCMLPYCIKAGHNNAGGAFMSDFQKITNLQSRIKKGTRLKQTSHEGGNYVVHLTTDPPIVFDVRDEGEVNRVLHDLDQI